MDRTATGREDRRLGKDPGGSRPSPFRYAAAESLVIYLLMKHSFTPVSCQIDSGDSCHPKSRMEA